MQLDRSCGKWRQSVGTPVGTRGVGGRPRRPTALTIALGNPSRTPIPDDMTVPAGGPIEWPPEIPSTIEAMRVWEATLPYLTSFSPPLVYPVDAKALARYCLLHVRFYAMPKDAPVREMLALDSAMSRTEGLFGMTPASRSSIHAKMTPTVRPDHGGGPKSVWEGGGVAGKIEAEAKTG